VLAFRKLNAAQPIFGAALLFKPSPKNPFGAEPLTPIPVIREGVGHAQSY